MYKEAMSVYSTKLGDFHETTIACRVHLGDSLEKLGRFDAAICEYHAVLEMRKELKGEKDSSVGDVLVMISKTLRQKEGRLPQALKELKRALKLYRSSLGDSDPKVAETVDDIASLYMECGNYPKAAAILDEVVKLKVATNGMLNTSVADTLLRLGIAQQSSGDLESALKSLKKAYSIFTSVRGEDSEEATTSLQNLARIYMEFGDYQVCPVNHRFLLC
jgi:tetratricopeptide (TPR) repeat protein